MNTKLGIQIDPGDNVVTLVDEAAAGDRVRYKTPQGWREITALDPIPFGHKLAAEEIPPEKQVLKYREAIGRATRPIKQGEHVHAHNVQSEVQGGPK